MATAKEKMEAVIAKPRLAVPIPAAARETAVIASDEWGPEAPPDHREFVRFTRLHRT